MHRFVFCFLTLALTLPAAGGADWFQFRGPDGQGHSDAKLATEWAPGKNVTWRKELPGVGWSSPVAVGGKIYLTTAVQKGEGVVLDIVLGIVGAVIGGWLFNSFGASGVTGVNLYSLFVAVIGSVVFLVLYHALRRVT